MQREPRRLTLRFVVFVVAVLLVPAAEARQRGGDAPAPWSADAGAVDAALGHLPDGNGFEDGYQQQLRREQPFFIIVPGILGSKLYVTKGDKRTQFWGDKGRGGDRQYFEDLRFNGEPAEAELLDRFEVFGLNEDVYGQLYEKMTFAAMPSRRDYLEAFGYDWRQEIPKISDKLDAFLRDADRSRRMAGRELVLVAHSMGGLAVTWWYHDRYKSRESEYSFKRSPRVLFLGVPHHGSPAALFNLVQGYGADAPRIEKKILEYVMKDLDQVGFTFYSVYQLLPFNWTRVRFDVKHGRDTPITSILDVGLYESCQWGGRFASEAGFYERELRPRLDAALKFRERMQVLAAEGVPNSVCFYGDEMEETPSRLEIAQKEDGGCTVTAIERVKGDGRVVAEFGRTGVPAHHGVFRRLTSEHAALPTDRAFHNFLESMHREVIARAVVKAPLRDAVISTFSGRNTLLNVPISHCANRSDEVRAILDFDRRIFNWRRQRNPASDEEMAAELYERAKKLDRQKKYQAATQLYAIVVALVPGTERAAYAANNMSSNLLRWNLWDIAAPYAAHAHEISSKMKLDDSIIPVMYQNLGHALDGLGHYAQAARYYRLAKTRNATGRLRELEDFADKHQINLDADPPDPALCP